MSETSRVVRCGECNRLLDEPADTPVDQRQRCPECGSTSRRFELGIESTVNITSSLMFEVRREFYERHPWWSLAFLIGSVVAALVGGLVVSGWVSVAVALLFASVLFFVGLRAVTRVRQTEKHGPF